MEQNIQNLKNLNTKRRAKLSPLLIIIGAVFITFLIWAFLNITSTVLNVNLPIPLLKKSYLDSTDGRVNVLLLGNAGGVHDGASLTDSIIVASYNLESKKTYLISVPRDLWVDSAKAKVNALYEYGDEGERLEYVKNKIEELVGVPVHYAVRLDFDGFERAIDLVEGIDVSITNSFDDYLYPITGKEKDLCGLQEKELDLSSEQAKLLNTSPGKKKVIVKMDDQIATQSADFSCRFEHLHFEKGITHMDGKLALKYVRSRMGSNGEGSDFARSKRQQIVLQAFREKALSLQTLFNLQKITGLISTFGDSFETDIPPEAFLEFVDLVKSSSDSESIVLGNLGDGKSVFITPSAADYGGAFVLIPPNGDFSIVKNYIKDKLNEPIPTPVAK